MRREDERRFPVESEFHASLARANETAGTCFQVNPPHSSVLAFKINLCRIIWIGKSNESVTATDIDPIGIDWASSIFAARWSAPTAVILKTTIDIKI